MTTEQSQEVVEQLEETTEQEQQPITLEAVANAHDLLAHAHMALVEQLNQAFANVFARLQALEPEQPTEDDTDDVAEGEGA